VDVLASSVGFLVTEQIFCTMFFVEMMVRLLAFSRLRNCLMDSWFMFDVFCTLSMMVEVWVIPLVVVMIGATGAVEGIGQLQFLRMARLLRLTRMTRIIRVVPEFVVMLKGLIAAIKSVFYTSILLALLVYASAIIFRIQVKPGSPLMKESYPNVPHAMWTLFFAGTLLDAPSVHAAAIYEESRWLFCCFLVFIFITSCTVLNMLIAIVCQVVGDVVFEERVRKDRFSLTTRLLDIMEVYDKDGTKTLGRDEFELFIANPEVRRVLMDFDVDVWGLISFVGATSWEDQDTPGSMGFQDILDLVLRMKGGGQLKLNDLLHLRKLTEERMDRLEQMVARALSSNKPSPTALHG